MLVFDAVKSIFQKSSSSDSKESTFLQDAWHKEFQSISVRTSIRAVLIGSLLFPATCIDYRMITEDEHPLFFAIKLATIITLLVGVIWKLSNLPVRVFLNTTLLAILTASMYRVGETGNYVQLNGASLPQTARHSHWLLHYYSYFLWYQDTAPIENAGLLAVAAFAGVFMAVARFRYRNAERNFKNSFNLELKNKELEKQKQTLLVLNKEVIKQKEALQTQANNLENANLQIEEKSQNVEKAYHKLEKTTQKLQKQHKNIEASINYARRIQNSMLPDLRRLQHFFPESFIIFRPRDTVSGDFYWFTEVMQRRFSTSPEDLVQNMKRQIVLAVVDCTGHGVPGAFMSVLGSNLLNQIVNERKITRPNLILSMMHESTQRTLRQENSTNDDGMDAAICLIKPDAKELVFAGACRPLVYVQGTEPPVKVQGTRHSIGGQIRDAKKRTYTSHVIDVSIPTTFYLFSDGYQDQFGGEQGRRFMFARLRKLFEQVHQKTAQEQKQILENELDEL